MTAVPDIPMLRGARPYVRRLTDEARKFGDSTYRFYQRVNWSYRYSDEFYRGEALCFLEGPEAYLGGSASRSPVLEDVFARKLSKRQLVNGVLKVLAHWLFRALGFWMDSLIRRKGPSIYRRGYVEDIEMAFDPEQPGVVRGIYPFPLGLPRQLRYIRHLIRKGYLFKLNGNAYSPADFIHFLRRRNIASLLRLEARAQLRQARSILRLGVNTIQISDEYDLGSLEFSRYLDRHRVRVINSAHGIGKYLPFHCYREFEIISERQREYYVPIRPCTYTFRRLNDLTPVVPAAEGEGQANIVLLGQASEGEDFIEENENRLLAILGGNFSGRDGVRLFYKPHPRRKVSLPSPGLERLQDVGRVNGQPDTLFMSFFSTCQIDPNFKGTKILVGTETIRPEIYFDETETIVPMDQLVPFIEDFLERQGPRNREG